MRGCVQRLACVLAVFVLSGRLFGGGGELEEGSLDSLYTLGIGREGCWKTTASSIDLRTSISCAFYLPRRLDKLK